MIVFHVEVQTLKFFHLLEDVIEEMDPYYDAYKPDAICVDINCKAGEHLRFFSSPRLFEKLLKHPLFPNAKALLSDLEHLKSVGKVIVSPTQKQGAKTSHNAIEEV